MREREKGGGRWVEHTVAAEEAGRTVREILNGPMQVSGRMIQKLTRSAGIRLNRGATHLKRRVRQGDVLAARLAQNEESGLIPEPMELSIVHEDPDVLVIDKPAGLMVHPVAKGQTGTLAHGVAHHFASRGVRARVRPVHRLDRDTSGLLLVAKTAFAHQVLDRQLREREMSRGYLALVGGLPAEGEGRIDAPIGSHPVHRHLRAVSEGGEPAATRFRVVERFTDAALLALELETGRTHQIRVHLAHLGHPVLGDAQYGGRQVDGLRRQALHATRLSFTHPTSGEPMSLESPLPPDLAAVREKL